MEKRQQNCGKLTNIGAKRGEMASSEAAGDWLSLSRGTQCEPQRPRNNRAAMPPPRERFAALRVTAFGLAGTVLLMPGILLTYPPAAAAAPFYRSSASADFRSCMHGQNIFTSDFVAEGSCIGNVPGGTFDVFASASARPGVLAALAGVNLNNVVFAGQTFVQADGFAAFSDILTLSQTPSGSKASFTFDVGGIGAAAM